MKVKCLFVLGALLGLCLRGSAKDYKLWYDTPASVWEEALPIGNGRIGAMVYGNPLKEVYQLNEESLWSGYPQDWNNRKAVDALPLVRKAVEREDYSGAGVLWKANAQGPYTARYLPMANLLIDHETESKAENVYRELNISNAQSLVTYEVDGVKFRRISFVSYPDQVMVVRIEADHPRAVSVKVALNSLLKYKVVAGKDGTLLLDGKAPAYVANRSYDSRQVVYEDKRGMRFKVCAKLLPVGGTCRANDSVLTICGADELLLILSAVVDSGNGELRLTDCHRSYQDLLKRHVDDYRTLFDRLQLSLGTDKPDKDGLPTDERLKRFKEDDSDSGLLELYYQYGRYLLISSSRPGGLPANLQGIWNCHIQPPWGSNYTTNINLEMNYWPAETTNLPECFLPLSDFIKRLAVNGGETAKMNYGINSGWVAHHNTDVWAQTAPTGGYDVDPKGSARWSCWPMAGVWLCQHLWEHYTFGGDKQYLAETAYPLMKGAAEFLLQWLRKDEATGRWGTNPSTSPENSFYYQDRNGKKQRGDIARSSGMDMGLAWDLLTNCIEASVVLGRDVTFRRRCEEVRAALDPLRIGSKGQLLEWHEEFEEVDSLHRHVSHLFALHPGRQIIPEKHPELTAACRKTLETRGDGGTGWAMAWKVNFWARLRDGNHAYRMLKNGLNYVDATLPGGKTGGTYANLFDAHPPFQIDGNFGGTAGITEMLVQSHAGYIHLLPALPDDWREGHIKGVRTRGGFTVDVEWKNGKVVALAIRSERGGVCRIREGMSVREQVIETECGKCYLMFGDSIGIVEESMDFAQRQLRFALTKIKEAATAESLLSREKRIKKGWGEPVSPRSTAVDGTLHLVSSRDWTSGFFPGELWFLYEYTGDEFWLRKARRHTDILEREKMNGTTHDMGFKMYCSFGNGYRLTHDKRYKEILLQSARTLSTRFKPVAGIIRSWDHNKVRWRCPVIIDNMMNLELLFWATRETGDSTFYQIAVSHARTTMRNHFRPDNSCCHVVDYDTISGKVLKKNTYQGFSHESAWARGQAWALYGYTMCYRETGLPEFKEQARRIEHYLFTHKNMPEDFVPYWDFDAPGIPDEPRDASAAAVIASALYELSLYDAEHCKRYRDNADRIMENLVRRYRASLNRDNGFLLLHSTGTKLSGVEVDAPIVYADYYFVEALMRKDKLERMEKRKNHINRKIER